MVSRAASRGAVSVGHFQGLGLTRYTAVSISALTAKLILCPCFSLSRVLRCAGPGPHLPHDLPLPRACGGAGSA